MAYVIDFQAFKTLHNEYIIKEFVFVQVDGFGDEFHIIFKPPQPYTSLPPTMQKQVDFLTKHIHGIPWESGYTNYDDIMPLIKKTLLKKARIIYVKGLERSKFVRNLFNNEIRVENLDDYFPNFKGTGSGDACVYHIRNYVRCSLSKARNFKSQIILGGY